MNVIKADLIRLSCLCPFLAPSHARTARTPLSQRTAGQAPETLEPARRRPPPLDHVAHVAFHRLWCGYGHRRSPLRPRRVPSRPSVG
eukprot:6204939-Pleurochrysis_carterae.AAC.1